MKTLNEIVASLSDKEKTAILFCEQDGNGKHFYQIHKLVQKGLMSLKSIPKLQNIKAYRLNTLGLIVKEYLEHSNFHKEWLDKYYSGILECTYRYRAMLKSMDPTQLSTAFYTFNEELMDGCRTRQPIWKMNRWLGYIQRYVIEKGHTSVSVERDFTRPFFRPLDFDERLNL